MGKNTMMKRSIKEHCKRTGNEDWMNLAELLVGNVGVIFTTSDLAEIRDLIMTYKVPAPARVGAVAPIDVIVPAAKSPSADASASTSALGGGNIPPWWCC